MTDLNQDFDVFSGEAKTVKFTLTDKRINGNPPLDLTNLTIEWVAVKASSACSFVGTADIEKCSVTGDIIITDAINGLCEFVLDGPDTESLFGAFMHQLSVVDTLGNPSVATSGFVTIIQKIPTTC